jgi:hypothetical protein
VASRYEQCLVPKILFAIKDKMAIDSFESVRTIGLLTLVNEFVMLIKLIQHEFNSVLPLGATMHCIEGKGFSPAMREPDTKLAHISFPL